MNEAVEDGVGIGRIADDFMPAVDGKLRGDHGRVAPIAIFEDFKEIVPGGGIERLQPPVVQDEKIGAAEVAQKARMTSIAARQGELCKEPGDTLVEHRPVVTAGFVAKCRSKPALAGAGWTGDCQIVVGVDPLAFGEFLEQGAIKTARTAVIDIFDASLLA